MALIWADRVADNSTSIGTGDFTVAGLSPALNMRPLPAVLTLGDTFYYGIANRVANEWEVGLGTYNGSSVFSRTTVLASSAGSDKVSFNAGWKDVWLDQPAALIAQCTAVFTGDSGSGGTAGLVPAPAAGTAAAGKFLKADGTWDVPPVALGAVVYQGTWNASTNTPALADGVGTKGYYYKVSVAGTAAIDGNSQWNVGDTIIFDGSTWDKIDGISNEVVSVAGRTGAVTLTSGDISGLGAGVATALAVNIGSAGSPVVNSGVLGTPLSGTLTNCSGLLTTNLSPYAPIADYIWNVPILNSTGVEANGPVFGFCGDDVVWNNAGAG